MRILNVTVAIVSVSMTGCIGADVFGANNCDYQGVYAYWGSVFIKNEGVMEAGVAGSLEITQQRDSLASVDLDWYYVEDGRTTIHISTARPVVARLSGDCHLAFDVEGDVRLGEGVTGFQLQHDGSLDGNFIVGSWQLSTDRPTEDYGGFAAQR